MRRLLLWAFNLAVAASAVLFVGVCGLWVRSYYRHDEIIFRDGIAFSDRGEVVVARWPAGRGFLLAPVQTPYGTEHYLISPAGVAVPLSYRVAPDAVVAAWLLLPVLGRLLWAWRQRRLRRRRRRMGHCQACGYDLRATPGRCPECGAVPEAAATLPAAP